mmetsp:Transcript_28637/g.71453  ORF Transcript_28637/g.71453 Transcript_28637/m.71453 type:complete len:346 (+) Transcript_28637:104-1141(+)
MMAFPSSPVMQCVALCIGLAHAFQPLSPPRPSHRQLYQLMSATTPRRHRPSSLSHEALQMSASHDSDDSRRAHFWRWLATPAAVGLLSLGGVPLPSEAAKNTALAQKIAPRIRQIATVLDELQADIYDEDWDILASYPQQLRAYVPIFTKYTDSAFPGKDPVDENTRFALRYEVGRLFGSVERLKRAVDKKDVRETEEAFAAMSVSFDRYLKAGDLYEVYDPIISTEKFFEGVEDSQLVYVPPLRDPPKIRDQVLLLRGPDKGKTGILLGVEGDEVAKVKRKGVVKLDTKVGSIRELKVVPYAFIAKRKGEQEPDESLAMKRGLLPGGRGLPGSKMRPFPLDPRA